MRRQIRAAAASGRLRRSTSHLAPAICYENADHQPSCSQYPPRHCVELPQEFGITRFRRGDQGRVEGAVRSIRAWLVNSREIVGETRNQTPRLLGIGVQHTNNVLNGDRVMIRMPAIEIGYHGYARVTNL